MKFEIPCSFTDCRTPTCNRQTIMMTTYRASIASRGKNMTVNVKLTSEINKAIYCKDLARYSSMEPHHQGVHTALWYFNLGWGRHGNKTVE